MADQLEPAFAGLPEGWKAWDVAEARGGLFVLVGAPGQPQDRNRPLVVEAADGAWKTVVRGSDLGDSWLSYLDTLKLEPVLGRLFLGWDNWWHWMEISRGRLTEVRGELLEKTSLLLPNPRNGTRTHLALAAGTDGARGTFFAGAHGPSWRDPESLSFRIPSGGFVQVDPDRAFADGSITVISSTATDDLLPYAVRNDDLTQDGVVVQAASRWTKPGRGSLRTESLSTRSPSTGRSR